MLTSSELMRQYMALIEENDIDEGRFRDAGMAATVAAGLMGNPAPAAADVQYDDVEYPLRDYPKSTARVPRDSMFDSPHIYDDADTGDEQNTEIRPDQEKAPETEQNARGRRYRSYNDADIIATAIENRAIVRAEDDATRRSPILRRPKSKSAQ